MITIIVIFIWGNQTIVLNKFITTSDYSGRLWKNVWLSYLAPSFLLNPYLLFPTIRNGKSWRLIIYVNKINVSSSFVLMGSDISYAYLSMEKHGKSSNIGGFSMNIDFGILNSMENVIIFSAPSIEFVWKPIDFMHL